MSKRVLIITIVLGLALFLATTVSAGSVHSPADLVPWQGAENDTPQGAGMLVLIIGIGAILLVGGMVLARHPDDPAETK